MQRAGQGELEADADAVVEDGDGGEHDEDARDSEGAARVVDVLLEPHEADEEANRALHQNARQHLAAVLVAVRQEAVQEDAVLLPPRRRRLRPPALGLGALQPLPLRVPRHHRRPRHHHHHARLVRGGGAEARRRLELGRQPPQGGRRAAAATAAAPARVAREAGGAGEGGVGHGRGRLGPGRGERGALRLHDAHVEVAGVLEGRDEEAEALEVGHDAGEAPRVGELALDEEEEAGEALCRV